MRDPVTAYLKRPGGKSHRWFAIDLGGKTYDGMRSRCGLKSGVSGLRVPKYTYAPSCTKCNYAPGKRESATGDSK